MCGLSGPDVARRLQPKPKTSHIYVRRRLILKEEPEQKIGELRPPAPTARPLRVFIGAPPFTRRRESCFVFTVKVNDSATAAVPHWRKRLWLVTCGDSQPFPSNLSHTPGTGHGRSPPPASDLCVQNLPPDKFGNGGVREVRCDIVPSFSRKNKTETIFAQNSKFWISSLLETHTHALRHTHQHAPT